MNLGLYGSHNQKNTKRHFLSETQYQGIARAARFLADLPVTFFGFLEVCMSGPEEDLAQGGRFLMWPERFI